MFEYLPLGAVINDKPTSTKILCVHAGIGASVNKVEELDKIPRPLKINLGAINDSVQQMAMDILWTDPTASEDDIGMSWN